MPENKIGSIPEFTQDESLDLSNEPEEEVKEAEVEESEEISETKTEEEEKEIPSVLPTEETPARKSDDSGNLEKTVQGLQEERVKLLKEIQELRGQRREIKQQEVLKVEQQIDELKDLHPDDVNLIEKVLRSKGYMTKGEATQMAYDAVKQEELGKFLEKYPEYKPENDPNDLNWSALQREFQLYRMPQDPHQIGEVLVRAHRNVNGFKIPSERGGIPEKRKQIESASLGSGGNSQRSSSQRKTLTPAQRSLYERGGWSEEEIQELEQDLE